MNHAIRSSAAIVLLIAYAVPANAERFWDGSIHFVDSRFKLSFGGYVSGGISDLRYVVIRTGCRKSSDEASFTIIPDDDNPRLATYRGRIRIAVDGQKVEVRSLRLTRRTDYSSAWNVHPQDVDLISKAYQKTKIIEAERAGASPRKLSPEGNGDHDL